MREPVIIRVREEQHVAQARQASLRLAREIGLSQLAAYYIATSVSELANNLFFHAAGGGTVTLASVRRNGEIGMEIIAQDDGPGIRDVELAMRDGFSSNGGLGGGLPGVQRLMDEFEITSIAGAGTRVVAAKWQRCR